VWRFRVTIVAPEIQQCFLCIVELHAAVGSIKASSFVQHCFYGEYFVAGKNKTYLDLRAKCPIFLSGFHGSPDIKFYGNLSSGSHADTCERSS
jgi:hypothetical protein